MGNSQLNNLLADFEVLDDWEERYRYVIELGRTLPAFNEQWRNATYKVNGCASQVWIHSTAVAFPDGTKLTLVGDSDALIVKGLIAIAFMIFSPRNVNEIATIDAGKVFETLGLKEHLTPQRSNGLASMVARIKADAARVAVAE